MSPERLWWWSTRLHRRGWTPIAKLLKVINFVAFHAVLPYECEIQRDIRLWHRGLGTVIHPNVRIGHGVHIAQSVTIAGPGSGSPMVIGDHTKIATHAVILVNREGPIRIGRNCVIGAGAIVRQDVPDGGVMVGQLARLERDSDSYASPT